MRLCCQPRCGEVGVRISALCTGVVYTDIWQSLKDIAGDNQEFHDAINTFLTAQFK